MIDLLGLDAEEIRALAVFDDAIFCLHLPKGGVLNPSSYMRLRRQTRTYGLAKRFDRV
jgi:hypothetical protein